MFTDGSQLENGAAGYAVAWRNGQTWEGIKTHMGFNHEAYDAECAALACALETAVRSDPAPTHVTIFTDAQAAIWRMASDEQGPEQKYALEATNHIRSLRQVREWMEEMGAGAGESDAGGEPQLFLPTPDFMGSAG
jgi:ribonuclease HI